MMDHKDIYTLYDESGFGQAKYKIYRLVSPRGFFRVENVTVEWFVILDNLE